MTVTITSILALITIISVGLVRSYRLDTRDARTDDDDYDDDDESVVSDGFSDESRYYHVRYRIPRHGVLRSVDYIQPAYSRHRYVEPDETQYYKRMAKRYSPHYSNWL